MDDDDEDFSWPRDDCEEELEVPSDDEADSELDGSWLELEEEGDELDAEDWAVDGDPEIDSDEEGATEFDKDPDSYELPEEDSETDSDDEDIFDEEDPNKELLLDWIPIGWGSMIGLAGILMRDPDAEELPEGWFPGVFIWSTMKINVKIFQEKKNHYIIQVFIEWLPWLPWGPFWFWLLPNYEKV